MAILGRSWSVWAGLGKARYREDMSRHSVVGLLLEIIETQEAIVAGQASIDAAVAAINTSVTTLGADVTALTAQLAAGGAVDTTALDAAVPQLVAAVNSVTALVVPPAGG